MNLGDIYLKTSLVLLVGSFGIGFLVALIWRLFKKIRWTTIAGITILGGLASLLILPGFHHTLFTAWHRHQNQYVPKNGCITYEPEFTRLYATYEMDRATFDQWVKNHPWPLKPSEDDGFLKTHDGPRLKLDSPAVSFSTEPAPNGQQLRVYFKDGVMYLSYNSM
jgi:hypothetical protein